ncbi:hypothetical protein AVEN_216741-1 [Araneus ventricosus]|uniref:Uncharacterized protein n=1 Tax=Araneus ventricosus TaxID=182803 RepID=A0A4Y2UD71_ARAVE|nr:hypothetical protein AVEN_216741-1 [Araneus ventricosus]
MIPGKRLKVFPETPEDHSNIQRHITQINLKSYTFELTDQKQLKVVIWGLPEDHTTTENFLQNSIAKNSSQTMSVICAVEASTLTFLSFW